MQLDSGTVTIRLRPDLAPNHVARAKELARAGFYDGTPFHRVIDGFMAQGGDPTGTGHRRLRPARPQGRVHQHAFRPGRHRHGAHRRSRQRPTRSSSSASRTARSSTGDYTVWGEVVDGMDLVDKIKRGEPVQDPDRIVSVKVAADVN